jgi:hypothetical protein
MWSDVMPADAGLSTGLEFCRREIKRQRDLVRRVLLWTFGPIMLTIARLFSRSQWSVRKDRGLFPSGLPFLIAIVVWIFMYFTIRVREQRDLQREIDELNDIETENRGL